MKNSTFFSKSTLSIILLLGIFSIQKINAQDSDGDGIIDVLENLDSSADSDMIQNSLDFDSDDDGVSDLDEYGVDVSAVNFAVDSDTDGIPDDMDSSSGGTDVNVNGVIDSFEPVDTDGDSVPNYLDLDSDGDGIYDTVEAGLGAFDNDNNGQFTANATTDTDGNGMADATESNIPTSTDGDLIPDYLDLDSDNDGIPDNIEAQTTIGYIAPNGDAGPANNGLDSAYPMGILPINTDEVDNPDYLDLDSDNEGGDDTTEAALTLGGNVGTNGLDGNSENVDDYTDVNGSFDDTQIDNFPDTDADIQNTGDVDFRDADDNDYDNDGIPDFVDLDDDNDGIPDSEECGPGVPFSLLSDGDFGVANVGTDTYFNGAGNGGGNPDNFNTYSKPMPAGITTTYGYEAPRPSDGNYALITNSVGFSYFGTESIPNFWLDIEDFTYDAPGNLGYFALFNADGNPGRFYEQTISGLTIGEQYEFKTAIINLFNPGYLENGNLQFQGISPLPPSISMIILDSGGGEIAQFDSGDIANDGIWKLISLTFTATDANMTMVIENNSVGGIGNDFGIDGVALQLICDTDGDGVPNHLDLDSDNDGIADIIEAGGTDANGDGMVDGFTDADNDGLNDAQDNIDNGSGAGEISTGTPLLDLDTDGDGTINRLDLDSDNDGIHDVVESGGTDTDGNGTADDDDDNVDNTTSNGIPTSAGGGNTPTDTGADGSPDYINLDSDGDGCSDANEAYVSANADGGDGGQYGTGTPAATGANGLVTAAAYNTGTVATVTDAADATACDIIDSDGDGIFDDVDIDDDNDGILDTIEGTLDTDGDGIFDALDLDSDNDGIPDIIEAGGVDTDGDGQIDYPTPGDPMSMDDTNMDGLDDGVATSPLPDTDSDGDGLVDRLDLDSDNDGIADIVEAGGTDANADGQVDYTTPGDPTTMVDVDGDGFIDTIDTDDNSIAGVGDGGTALPDTDTDGDGFPNRLDLDSDNDGIHDVVESGGTDTDGNGTADDDDDNVNNTATNGIPTSAGGGNTPTDTGTDGSPDYLNLDSDGDGCSDANEAYVSATADGDDGGQYGTGTPAAIGVNGLVTAATYDTGVVTAVTDDTDATACAVIDIDGDGVTDDQEIADGTDPNDPCDFVIASISEVQSGDYLIADCDGDGVTNEVEILDGTNPEDPCDFVSANITLAQSGDYLIEDCDGDGVLNGTEITDGTNPDDPCDFIEASITLSTSGNWITADCDGDTIQNGQEITDGTDPYDPCSSIGGIPPAGSNCDMTVAVETDLVNPGVNDGIFQINNIESYPNTVRIYNRWGILVFETVGYDNSSNAFRGISNGRSTIQMDKELPVGVYFYIIEYVEGGISNTLDGYLYVNR